MHLACPSRRGEEADGQGQAREFEQEEQEEPQKQEEQAQQVRQEEQAQGQIPLEQQLRSGWYVLEFCTTADLWAPPCRALAHAAATASMLWR